MVVTVSLCYLCDRLVTCLGCTLPLASWQLGYAPDLLHPEFDKHKKMDEWMHYLNQVKSTLHVSLIFSVSFTDCQVQFQNTKKEKEMVKVSGTPSTNQRVMSLWLWPSLLYSLWCFSFYEFYDLFIYLYYILKNIFYICVSTVWTRMGQ